VLFKTTINFELLDTLINLGCVVVKDVLTKSGVVSPIYIDLRKIVSYNDVLMSIAKTLINSSTCLIYNKVLAIPYTALPIGVIYSFLINKSLIYNRKTVKDYGTRKLIEGDYNKGDSVLLLDDVVSTGLSKLEIIDQFKSQLVFKDILVLVDRRHSQDFRLEESGYNVISSFSINDINDRLFQRSIIDEKKHLQIYSFFNE
jgi:uridine monophosphate synthetase